MSELEAAIKSLNPTKAAGPDSIHPRFLHHLGPVGTFNISWSTIKIPQGWRVADIRPVPKAGKDPKLMNSYRPISQTSVIGKLMERIVIIAFAT